jgi:hypothetical protein
VVIRPEEFLRASRTQSLAGGLCQLIGSGLAVVAGLITIGSVLSGRGLDGLLIGGSATFALAMAGAPIAALGSIANSQKASKELLKLYVSESVEDPPRRRRPEGWRRLEAEGTDSIEGPECQQGRTGEREIPPPPPPPAR